MKKLLVSTAAGLAVLASNSAFAETKTTPVQHDTIQIGNTGQDDQFHNDMAAHFNNLFNTFFNGAFGPQNPLAAQDKNFIPIRQVGSVFTRSDMYETNKDIIITMDMPGIKKEDVDLQIAPGIVSVKYEQKAETESKDKSYVISERRMGSVNRQFSLPNYALVDEAEAAYKDGVLNITIPKDEKSASKAKKLEIK